MAHVLADMMNNELKSTLEEQRVMITEAPNTSKEQRDRMAEILFE